MMNLLDRRRLLMSPKADNYYEGFFRGWIYGSTMTRRGSIKDDLTNLTGRETLFVTRLIPITAGHSITFSHTFNGRTLANDYGYNMASYYDANGSYVGSVGSRGDSYKTRTVPSNVTQVRFSNIIPILDDYYVYDNTAGEYVWKGKNVV